MRRFFILALLATGWFALPARAADVHGGADLGFWFLTHDGAAPPDPYGLLMTGFRLSALDLTDGETSHKLNVRLNGRALVNAWDHPYALGSPNRARWQLNEANISVAGLGDAWDLWLGRQFVLEAGSVLFDGVRAIYRVREDLNLAVYGGLGSDPRTWTGYPGSLYRKNPFNPDLRTAGVYTSYRTNALKVDGAFRLDLLQADIHRATVFAQGSYAMNSVWGFSALAEGDVTKTTALRNAGVFVTTRPRLDVTNTLSFEHFSALAGAFSPDSLLPPILSPSYNSVRDHVQLRVFDRKYVFAAVTWARRSFDGRNQMKYTLGYRDPAVFKTPTELRVQSDVLDNYLGFNTVLGASVARTFAGEKVRVELGGTYFANERDLLLADPQTHHEFALNTTGAFRVHRNVTCTITYGFYREGDPAATGAKLNLHEVLVSSSLVF